MGRIKRVVSIFECGWCC